LFEWQNVIFSVLAMMVVVALVHAGARRRAAVPSRGQSLLELFVDGFNQFVCGILGPEGRAHTPFIGTLFLYILAINWIGLIPLMKSPTVTSMPSPVGLPIPLATLPLAVCSIVYVNWAGMKASGIKGYLFHFLGSPTNAILWLISPLVLVLHALGELSRVFSLSMRLFCNISGEDTLIAVVVQQSVALTESMHLPPLLPLHLPFLFLGLLTGFIQAFVFALLTTIYLALILPHEEHATEREFHGPSEAHAGHHTPA
jgi:F-type H+-transporting ATPase subunit a